MAYSVELKNGSPENITIKDQAYCEWCFTISQDDKKVFLPSKIGLDFTCKDGKPELITGATGADFKKEDGVKESEREVITKGDNKDRQIIWRKVPDKQKQVDLCFLIKGTCGNAGDCLISLEHFVNDIWQPLEYDSGEPGDKKDKTKRRKIKGPNNL